MECGIALGSNTGDRPGHLREAVAALRLLDPRLIASPVYETAPVDCPPGSPSFLNAVVIMDWLGTPHGLMTRLRDIELSRGRSATRPRNAPRPIDLDILYAGSLKLSSDALTLPHPRFHLRRFVLQPLSDLRPDLVLPGFRQSIQRLLDELPDSEPSPRRLLADL